MFCFFFASDFQLCSYYPVTKVRCRRNRLSTQSKTEMRLNRVTVMRESAGVSLTELAARLGVSPETLLATEAESRDLWVSDLHRLSRALDIPVSELLVDTSVEEAVPAANPESLAKVAATIEQLESEIESDEARVFVQMLAKQVRDIVG